MDNILKPKYKIGQTVFYIEKDFPEHIINVGTIRHIWENPIVYNIRNIWHTKLLQIETKVYERFVVETADEAKNKLKELLNDNTHRNIHTV